MRKLKWLYPGMRVKRWLLLIVVGLTLFAIGTVQAMAYGHGLRIGIAGAAMMLGGIVLMYIGGDRIYQSLIGVFLPNRDELVDIVYRRRQLAKGPKVVVVGGGTGLSTMLHGLKEYTANITAVVTVADDGGSSGRLRQEFDMPPPGDLRNCMVALADNEAIMGRLFDHRFTDGSSLSGHSFGNLFITAMWQIMGQDFEAAVKESSRVLAVRGQVLPSTSAIVQLVAEHVDGSRTVGESQISKAATRIRQVRLEPAACQPSAEALRAIHNADLIVLGPGSLYTSIIPNLLVEGIAQAIRQARGITAYVCNVMTQPNETSDYTATEHLQALLDHGGAGLVDFCVVNTADIPADMLNRYRQEGAQPVAVDSEEIWALGVQPLEESIVKMDNFVRHDPAQLARILIDLVLDESARVSAATA